MFGVCIGLSEHTKEEMELYDLGIVTQLMKLVICMSSGNSRYCILFLNSTSLNRHASMKPDLTILLSDLSYFMGSLRFVLKFTLAQFL